MLSKLVPLLFLPLGAALVMLLAALCSRRRSLIAAPFLLLALLGAPVISDHLMRSLEERFPYRSNKDCPKADAVFVFGGMFGLRAHPGGGVEWNEAAERFDRAIDLYQSGRAGVVVLSGGAQRYEGGPDEGELLKKKLYPWAYPIVRFS